MMQKFNRYYRRLVDAEPINTIRRIHLEAHDSMIKNVKGAPLTKISRIMFWLLWYALPITLSVIAIIPYLSNNMGEINGLNSFIGVAIPLFTGVFFSYLLVIPTNIKKSREANLDQETSKNIQRGYKQMASIILYLILICIYIIFLFLLSLAFIPHNGYIKLSYYLLTMFLSTRFIVAIIFLTARHYYLYQLEL